MNDECEWTSDRRRNTGKGKKQNKTKKEEKLDGRIASVNITLSLSNCSGNFSLRFKIMFAVEP